MVTTHVARADVHGGARQVSSSFVSSGADAAEAPAPVAPAFVDAPDELDDRREAPVALAQVVRLVAAAASLAAAAVHASAIALHTADIVHAGAFVAMTVFQAWWAYLVLRSTSARVLVAGAVGHGSIVLLWLLTRVGVSLEWLPGAPRVEEIGLKDVMATVLAVTALVAIDILSRRDLAARRVRSSRAGAAVAGFVLAAVLLGAVGSFATGHDHSHNEIHADASHDE